MPSPFLYSGYYLFIFVCVYEWVCGGFWACVAVFERVCVCVCVCVCERERASAPTPILLILISCRKCKYFRLVPHQNAEILVSLAPGLESIMGMLTWGNSWRWWCGWIQTCKFHNGSIWISGSTCRRQRVQHPTAPHTPVEMYLYLYLFLYLSKSVWYVSSSSSGSFPIGVGLRMELSDMIWCF